MARLGHGLEKLFKSRSAADVLWRSPLFAINEPRIIRPGLRRQDIFDFDPMTPVVPKIIG